MEDTARKPRSVLIVEDDTLSARVAEKILGRLGYAVLGVIETGEEAVDAARSLGPDVVLMDINLAGPMDGVTAAKDIIDGLGVPVIFLTATVDRDIMDRVAGTGAAGYIQKPVKLLDLKANLEMAITRRNRQQLCATDAAVTLYKAILSAVLAACDRPLAVADPHGRILLAHPDEHLAGMPFAEAFPAEPPLPGPADVALTSGGESLGWLRLLS
ncbi:response regulator receiver [Desulfovibrio sp. DV]|uniref:response regulator n=1 Tax=Desulfovibrio sp. DV TaxID=1844708 RepID=UPI00094BA344|nr:response regulator [Desulfovibrio sp. DV]OLN26081.1 response regulator receiver [Desulfovibrio sp. DV]